MSEHPVCARLLPQPSSLEQSSVCPGDLEPIIGWACDTGPTFGDGEKSGVVQRRRERAVEEI